MNSIRYYYINLDSRQDRNQHIINQFEKFGITNYERIPAIKNDYGHAGCTQSHILALQTFIVSQEPRCIILEDDFEFTVSKIKYNELLHKLEESHIDWNIVMLSGNIKKYQDYNDFLKICNDAQTTSGYMVNRNFSNTLLENYTEGFGLLMSDKRDQGKHCIDQYWKKLQTNNNKWFVFAPKCGRQMESFSDIEGRKTFYKC
jgi:GR25 family glycosyltransferase involved in LPS biosynthesis